MRRVENENGDRLPDRPLFDEDARLDGALEVDAVAIQSRRRAGLQPAHLEAERLRIDSASVARRRLAVPSRRPLLGADVNQAVQERPGGDDQRAARVASPSSMHDAGHAAVLDVEDAPAWPKIHVMFGSRSSASVTHAA